MACPKSQACCAEGLALCFLPVYQQMFAGGKLLFGGSVLNGYGLSRKNLLKQIDLFLFLFSKVYLMDDSIIQGPVRKQIVHSNWTF